MTISSSFSFNSQQYQPLSSQKTTLANYDVLLANSANYQQVDKSSETKQTSINPAQSSDNRSTVNDMVTQYAYAPNISAMFNAYLEKQRLNSSLDSKTDTTAQRLSSNGMDKKMAEQYAKSSVDVYKQILESQLNSKIATQVEQQKEFKQKSDASSTANPYVQMTGSLVNLYS